MASALGVVGGAEDGLVGEMADGAGVELSTVRISPLFTVNIYISTGDCCIEPPAPELSEFRECPPPARGVGKSASFAVVLAGGCRWSERSGKVVVETPFGAGEGFLSSGWFSTTPLIPPPWGPSSKGFMLEGGERSPFRCGRGSERSDVCVE